VQRQRRAQQGRIADRFGSEVPQSDGIQLERDRVRSRPRRFFARGAVRPYGDIGKMPGRKSCNLARCRGEESRPEEGKLGDVW